MKRMTWHSALWLLAAVALPFLWVTVVRADIDATGANKAPVSEMTADHQPAIQAPASDLDIRDLGQGTERPMRIPETEEVAGLSLRGLLVPNQMDFDAAREADIQSAVSF
jgi:hypothetical protein